MGDSKKRGSSVNNWASEQVQLRQPRNGYVWNARKPRSPCRSGGSGQARSLESCGAGLAGSDLQPVLEQLSPGVPADWGLQPAHGW